MAAQHSGAAGTIYERPLMDALRYYGASLHSYAERAAAAAAAAAATIETETITS